MPKTTTLLKLIWWPFKVLKDHPVLLRGKEFNVVGFGAFAAIEAMSMVLFFSWYMHLRGVSALSIPLYLYLLGGLLVWLGAKSFHWIALGKKFLDNPLKYIKETGFYMQGGVIGAFVWLVIVALTRNISFSILADGLCWGGLIGQAVGRLGCFNYGCCFGKPVKHGIGIRYTNAESKIVRWRPELRGVKVHPTQLYMAGLDLALFAVIWAFLPKIPVGVIFLTFLVWHGVTRVFIEQFRFDIIHHEGRNWTTWYTALALASSSLVFGLLLVWVDRQFLQLINTGLSVNFSEFLLFLFSTEAMTGAVLTTGILIFAGYGIHGKNLGTFPSLNLSVCHTSSETCTHGIINQEARN